MAEAALADLAYAVELVGVEDVASLDLLVALQHYLILESVTPLQTIYISGTKTIYCIWILARRRLGVMQAHAEGGLFIRTWKTSRRE